MNSQSSSRRWEYDMRGWFPDHLNSRKFMTKLTYGDGLLHTQQGKLSDGTKCLTITRLPEPKPINSTPNNWAKQVEEESVDCILAFKNIEGARTLQDELNELISVWSREQGKVV